MMKQKCLPCSLFSRYHIHHNTSQFNFLTSAIHSRTEDNMQNITGNTSKDNESMRSGDITTNQNNKVAVLISSERTPEVKRSSSCTTRRSTGHMNKFVPHQCLLANKLPRLHLPPLPHTRGWIRRRPALLRRWFAVFCCCRQHATLGPHRQPRSCLCACL